MKIIDFDRKGNVVRFYLAHDDLEKWYGDDWDDTPYECNAGRAYDQFIAGYRDVSFPYNDLVLEPCSGEFSSKFCKDSMAARQVPCIIVIPGADRYENESWIDDRFSAWVGSDQAIRFYFGDAMEPDVVLPKE